MDGFDSIWGNKHKILPLAQQKDTTNYVIFSPLPEDMSSVMWKSQLEIANKAVNNFTVASVKYAP